MKKDVMGIELANGLIFMCKSKSDVDGGQFDNRAKGINIANARGLMISLVPKWVL